MYLRGNVTAEEKNEIQQLGFEYIESEELEDGTFDIEVLHADDSLVNVCRKLRN